VCSQNRTDKVQAAINNYNLILDLKKSGNQKPSQGLEQGNPENLG
jgi:hypothetical protein